jgi:hypothetical protein
MAAPPGVGRGRSGGDVESELLYQLIGFPADDFIDILAPLLERLMVCLRAHISALCFCPGALEMTY